MASLDPRRDLAMTHEDAHGQALWAQTLLAAFAEAGVRDVVVSPGSRSTPFVLAADAHPQLTCHDVVDERSAAYFALGQARVSGRPSLLLCTSGTAVANYLPAVVEAGMAFVPVVVLSADRPIDLAHCGANQTIDQLKLFGDHARRFFDLGLWDVAPRALRSLRRTVAQAVFASTYPLPGAVHLNARARKPLEPVEPATATARLAQARPMRPLRQAAAADLDRLAQRLNASKRSLMVAGPAPIAHGDLAAVFFDVARRSDSVVFADPASQWRFVDCPPSVTKVDGFDSLLHSPSFRRRWRPDLIVQWGRVPTSGAFERVLEEWDDIEHWVIDPHGWNDPQSTVDHLLFSDLRPTLDGLAERLVEDGARDAPWLSAWANGDDLVWRRVEEVIRRGVPALSEGEVARCAVESLGDGDLLVIGNSLPIREVDLYGRGGGRALRVASQRGTSGIDGVVSGAFGAAQQFGGPALLLVGDVSFLHDLSGLAAAALVPTPVVLLVVQNQGGRIFEQLPVRRFLSSTAAADQNVVASGLDGSALRHWLTPHDVSLRHAAALYGLGFHRVTEVDALRTAVGQGLARAGTTVIEAVVPKHGAAEQNEALRREVEHALDGADLT